MRDVLGRGYDIRIYQWTFGYIVKGCIREARDVLERGYIGHPDISLDFWTHEQTSKYIGEGCIREERDVSGRGIECIRENNRTSGYITGLPNT